MKRKVAWSWEQCRMLWKETKWEGIREDKEKEERKMSQQQIKNDRNVYSKKQDHMVSL